MPRLLLILIMALVLCGCQNEIPQEKILLDFETDAELDRIHWRCHALMSLSKEHVTHGKSCLKLEVFPSKYPGMNPELKGCDWREYRAFCFDIFNPREEAIPLVVWIDDGSKNREFGDRLNEVFNVKKGATTITIPLGNLLTSGTKRQMNLGRICQFGIYMMNPEEKTELHVDYIRLVR